MHSKDHGVRPGPFDEAKARMKRGMLPEVRAAAERDPDIVAEAEAEPEPVDQDAVIARRKASRLAAIDELAAAAKEDADRAPAEGEKAPAREPVPLGIGAFKEAIG